MKSPREHWQDYCAVAPGIRAQFGVNAALDYIVGEKLMVFAQTAETDEVPGSSEAGGRHIALIE